MQGYNGCPNKWNPYHSCSVFCDERWGEGKVIPDPEYERRRQKMLLIYPLPDGWQEIYDPGTWVSSFNLFKYIILKIKFWCVSSGRHYYWCLESDKVSWFPPGHPKAIPVVAAAKVRENITSRKSPPEKDNEKEMVKVFFRNFVLIKTEIIAIGVWQWETRFYLDQKVIQQLWNQRKTSRRSEQNQGQRKSQVQWFGSHGSCFLFRHPKVSTYLLSCIFYERCTTSSTF